MPDSARHVRIDEGIKRGPRKPRIVKKAEVERLARRTPGADGRFNSSYTIAQRNAVVLEAANGLEIGILPKDVALKHGIPQSTLYSWLLDTETAQQARSRFFHHKLAHCLTQMEVAAENPLELARWRDLRRAWAETAAVRDSANYAPKQEVKVTAEVKMITVLDNLSQSILDRINTVSVQPQLTDKTE